MTNVVNLHLRGHLPIYQVGEGHQVCPSCGGKHWLIGRRSAECAHCYTALPLSTMAMDFNLGEKLQ